MESECLGFACVEAAIHSAEDEIGTVACTHFKVLQAIREASEAANIRHNRSSRSYFVRRHSVDGRRERIVRVVLALVIMARRLMMNGWQIIQ